MYNSMLSKRVKSGISLFLSILMVLSNVSYSLATPIQVSGENAKDQTLNQTAFKAESKEKKEKFKSKDNFVEGELIVKFKAGAETASVHKAAKTKVLKQLKQGTQKVKVDKGVKLEEALKTYKENPQVEYVELNYKGKALFSPNDPMFSQQWPLAKVQVPQAWDQQQASSTVKIAVIDTGVDLDHPELAGNLLPGKDFIDSDLIAEDMNGHGTHVAGIAAAIPNNGLGIAGVAGGAKIIPVRVLDAEGYGDSIGIADGIRWAADQGAKVINLSLGVPEFSNYLLEAVNHAYNKGAVIVAAVGNDAMEGAYYPAAFDNVIAVSATMANDQLASFSNFGPEIDVAAPGVGILSTTPNTRVSPELPLNYASMSGTSMAAPMVAGLAGLLLSKNSTLTPAAVKQRITETSDDLGAPGLDEEYGYGRINVFKALNYANLPSPGDQFEPNNLKEQATLSHVGIPSVGTLHQQSDEDWFKYNLGSSMLRVALTPPPQGISKVQIYNESGSLLKEITTLAGEQAELAFQVTMGSYYFKVISVGALNQGTYTLEVNEVDAYELNDSFAQATSVNFNNTINANLSPLGDEDLFKFTVLETGVVEFNLSGPQRMDGVLVLYNSEQEIVAIADYLEGTTEALAKQVKPGEYFLQVSDFYGNYFMEEYSLTSSFSAGLRDSYEINDSLEEAVSIPLNEDLRAKINPRGDLDYYRFEVPLNRATNITLSSPQTMDGFVELYDSQGNVIYSADDGYIGETESFGVFLLAGTYYLQVSDFEELSHSEDYTLRVNVDIVAPSVIGSNPESQAQGIPLDQAISLDFSEEVLQGAGFNQIVLKDQYNSQVAVNLSFSNNRLVVTPHNPLLEGFTYTLMVPANAFVDWAGNSLAEIFNLSFTTWQDTSAPVLLKATPGNLAKNVFVGQQLTLEFSTNLLIGETYEGIVLRDQQGNIVPIGKELKGKKLIISPLASLSYNTGYQLNVPVGAVTGPEKTILGQAFEMNFTTGDLIESKVKEFAFDIMDAIMDPVETVIYLVAKGEKRVYAFDYATDTLKFIDLPEMPDSIDLGKGQFQTELYVTLDKLGLGQAGKVAIIDKNELVLKDTIPLDIDPYDLIAGRDGNLYVSSAWGQWTYLQSYNRVTKQKQSQNTVYHQSKIQLHPSLNHIYSITRAIHPVDVNTFKVDNGTVTRAYDSPYHGEHALNATFVIDPSGRYMFNGTGTIFSLSSEQNKDLTYAGKLSSTFVDAAFEPDSSKLYTTNNSNSINVYNGETFALQSTSPLVGKGQRLFKKEGLLVAVIKPDSFQNRSGLQIIASGPDAQAPKVVKADPEQGKDKVLTSKPITIEFSENLGAGPNWEQIKVNDFKGQPVAINKQIVGNKVVIKPLSNLRPISRYQVTIPAGAVEDLAKNPSIEAFGIDFVTAKDFKDNGVVGLPFEVTDAQFDQSSDVLYLTSRAENSVYAVNLLSGEIKALDFEEYMPESLELGKGEFSDEIYVSLMFRDHSPYWWDEDQTGTIAVIDKTTFEVKDYIYTEVDPNDLVVDEAGFLYVPSGSGQWSNFDSYDLSTGERVGRTGTYYGHQVKFNSVLNKLYSIGNRSNPADFNSYNISAGNFVEKWDSIYHGDYYLNIDFGIDPTGRHIFNGSGDVFQLALNKEHDLIFERKLDRGFKDIAFDEDFSKVYTLATNEYKLYMYETDNLTRTNTLNLAGPGKRIFKGNGYLLTLLGPTQGFKTALQLFTEADHKPLTLKESTTLTLGFKETLVATFDQYFLAQQELTWSSSNPEVASVDSKGTIQGLKVGTSIITATTKDGLYSATSTVTVRTFSDVQGHWAQSNMELMAVKGVVSGRPNNIFAPYDKVTRAEFASMLVRTLGLEINTEVAPRFSDVPKNQWYFAYVEAAAKAGIISGYGNGSFGPNNSISRQEMSIMMVRAIESLGITATIDEPTRQEFLSKFSDAGKIHSWAQEGVIKASHLGLIYGSTPTTINPLANTNRAEAATVMKRLMERSGLL